MAAIACPCMHWVSQWDYNVGHQFHQQVWPLFTATQSESPQLFGSPTITRTMIDSACRDDSSSMGVRHGAWKSINQVSRSATLQPATRPSTTATYTCCSCDVSGLPTRLPSSLHLPSRDVQLLLLLTTCCTATFRIGCFHSSLLASCCMVCKIVCL